MNIFLVGGAVRDELLGLPVKDRDWVVTEATPEMMAKAGFRPVGQDFPVFLHPQTHEEYALARTERKSGHGYAGFTFHTSPDITLEEDLQRRDITINAIAKDADGQLIDPYHGQQDLQQRTLRHISPAFREDPLRILRVARFAARFEYLGFTIAPETMTLMQEIVADGEADFLVAERVWQETQRALESTNPERYFLALAESQALAVVMPEIAELFASPESLNSRSLQMAAQQGKDKVVRFACAVCSGTNDTRSENHEAVAELCTRMRIPTQFKEVAQLCAEVLDNWSAAALDKEQRLALLLRMDGFRRQERFELLLHSCDILATCSGQQSTLSQQLLQDLSRCKAINIQPMIQQGLKGQDLADALHQARLQVMA